MKCKICGHSTRTLKAMGEHYRKKHPSKMKRSKTKTITRTHKNPSTHYCPTCGHLICT